MSKFDPAASSVIRTTTIRYGRHQTSVVSREDFFHDRLLKSFRIFDRLPRQATTSEDVYSVARNEGEFVVRRNGEVELTTRSSKQAYRKLRHFVSRSFREAYPELLWLHAGAAAFNGEAVVLAGAFGMGKSTMIAGLCEAGWTYLSDDVIPVDIDARTVSPYPLWPNRRMPVDRIVSRRDLGKLHREKIPLDDDHLALGPHQIQAVVFPEFEKDVSPAIEPYPPSTAALELMKRCLNFSDHQGDAVKLLSGLIDSVPFVRLRHPGDPAAARLLIDRFGD